MATTVTVSYPANTGDWEREQLRTDHMRAYLKRSNGRAREGDAWSVSVNAGCGVTSDPIPLRVEAVDGDEALDETAELAFVERDTAGGAAGDGHGEAESKN